MSDTFKRWATETYYDDPGEDWDGDFTKVEPTTERFEQGYRPNDKPGSQQFNWMMNQQDKLADAIYDPTVGVEAIRSYADLTALAAATGMLDGGVAYVPGYGLYRYDSGSAAGLLNIFIVANNLSSFVLKLDHRVERNIIGCFSGHKQLTRIFFWEEAFWA
jgi:hypothetical protein